MISPVAEGNVGDVEPLRKVGVTGEPSGSRPQLEQVGVQQPGGAAGRAGSKQELTWQRSGSQSSQASEVETSGGALTIAQAITQTVTTALTNIRREELLGRAGAGHQGRPNSEVQLGGEGGGQTLRPGLENLERQSSF